MKVVEFIHQLNKIGYDENTELTFSCVEGTSGAWYNLEPDSEQTFSFGYALTGIPYCNDQIDFCLNVDACEEYLKSKCEIYGDNFSKDIRGLLEQYGF